MDIVKQRRNREWALLGLVGTMALLNNLPADVLARWHVEVSIIMPALGLLVMLALMLYVRVFVFLLFTLLIFGSNLPETWAVQYGVNRDLFLATLITMVGIYLFNYVFRLLPNGLDDRKKSNPNPEATAALIKAIENDVLPYIRTILSIDFDLDIPDEQGLTPLMHAARRGNYKVVKMLLVRGASALVDGPKGRAADIALTQNFPLVAERLKISEHTESNTGKSSSVKSSKIELLGN